MPIPVVVGTLVDFIDALLVKVLITTLVDDSDVLGVVQTDVTNCSWIRHPPPVDHHDDINDPH